MECLVYNKIWNENPKHEIQNPKQIQILKFRMFKFFWISNLGFCFEFRYSNLNLYLWRKTK